MVLLIIVLNGSGITIRETVKASTALGVVWCCLNGRPGGRPLEKSSAGGCARDGLRLAWDQLASAPLRIPGPISSLHELA